MMRLKPKPGINDKSILVVVACCLIAVSAGCAHREAPVISGKDMPPPEALFEKITADAAPGKVLSGILHVAAHLPRERLAFKIAAAARRPDSLRLEDLSVIGLPDFMLTAKGDEVRMFLPRSGEFLIGTESSPDIRRIFPPAVKPLDLVYLLFGQPPAIDGAKTLKGSVDGTCFRLDVYTRGNWAQSIWVDPATGRVDRVEIADPQGKTAYRARFEDFTDAGPISVPGRIEIETGAPMTVRLSLRNPDPEIAAREDDPDLFLLKPPEGVTPRAAP